MQHLKMENVYLQDLQLDNPDAAHLLSLFLGRAIVDEALPPSFLAAVLPTLEDHSEGVNVVQSTGLDTLRMYVARYACMLHDMHAGCVLPFLVSWYPQSNAHTVLS